MYEILKSNKFVIENSDNVKINSEKLNDFCDSFVFSKNDYWLTNIPDNLKNLDFKNRANFLFLLNSISFSYWWSPKWKIDFHGEELDWVFWMVSVFSKAIENNFKILDAKYISNISEKDFTEILKWSIEIPLFQERLKILREVWKVLLEKFDWSFENVIKSSNNDSEKLLQIILENFPSFKDEAIYKGKKVYFFKRAQLLISDIYHLINHSLTNMDKITAFADYKIPFILRRLWILEYSKGLADKIDDQIEIKKWSNEEIEIRSNTIWAIELMKQKLQIKFPEIQLININDNIWLASQKKLENDKPYHLTRTTAY